MKIEDIKHFYAKLREQANLLTNSSNALEDAILQIERLEQRLIKHVSGASMNWWDANLPKQLENLKSWLGTHTDISRVTCRKLIQEKNYKSILDIGCGLGIEYDGFKVDNYSIEYRGIEISKFLTKYCMSKGINVTKCSCTNLPFDDKSFDVVYIREVLEHLPNYDKALKEAIRVTKHEVMVIWFLIPSEAEQDKINLQSCDNVELFHNVYSRKKLELFLNSLGVAFGYTKLDEKRMLLRVFKLKG